MLNILTRDTWQAAPPKAESPTNYQVTHVFWMNVKKDPCFTFPHCREMLKRSQRYNMTVQNQRDIRYNFMVGGDGNVYEGRGWGCAPLLPKDYYRVNTESMIVGFMGHFETAEELPDIMFKAGQALTEYGLENDYIAKDYVFHDFLKKEAPKRTAYSEGDLGREQKYYRHTDYERNND